MTALEAAASLEMGAALIEDYFEVNALASPTFAASTPATLAGPFCVTGAATLDFALTVALVDLSDGAILTLNIDS